MPHTNTPTMSHINTSDVLIRILHIPIHWRCPISIQAMSQYEYCTYQYTGDGPYQYKRCSNTNIAHTNKLAMPHIYTSDVPIRILHIPIHWRCHISIQAMFQYEYCTYQCTAHEDLVTPTRVNPKAKKAAAAEEVNRKKAKAEEEKKREKEKNEEEETRKKQAAQETVPIPSNMISARAIFRRPACEYRVIHPRCVVLLLCPRCHVLMPYPSCSLQRASSC